MKKFLISLFVGLALIFANVSTVLAGHYWEVKMSEPKATSQLRTFNLEFVTLSEASTDQMNVELFQNAVSLGSKTTTAGYGDSGMFVVTVPSDGTYQYTLKATNTPSGEVKNTPAKSVTVTTQGNTTVITSSDATSQTGGTGAGGTSGSGVENQPADDNGSTAGAETGQVGEGASTDRDVEAGSSLAASTLRKAKWPIAILIMLAVASAVYLRVMGRNNPFGPRD